MKTIHHLHLKTERVCLLLKHNSEFQISIKTLSLVDHWVILKHLIFKFQFTTCQLYSFWTHNFYECWNLYCPLLSILFPAYLLIAILFLSEKFILSTSISTCSLPSHYNKICNPYLILFWLLPFNVKTIKTDHFLSFLQWSRERKSQLEWSGNLEEGW